MKNLAIFLRKNNILLTFLFVFICGSTQAQIALVDSINAYDITSKIEYIVDKEGKVDFNKIRESKFNKIENPIGFQHQGNETYWLRLAFDNQSKDPTKKWIIAFENNFYLSVLDAYIPDKNGNYTIKKIGNATPYNDREIKDRFFALPMVFAPKQKPIVYVKMRSNLYINHTLKVYDELSFYKYFRGSDGSYFMVNGILLMRLIFSLTFFFLIRDTMFRAYCFYGITICCTMYLSTGVGPSTFANNPKLANSLWLLFSNIHLATLSYFTYQVCLVKTKMPWAKWVLLFAAIFGIIHGIYSWNNGPMPNFMNFYTLLSIGIVTLQFYATIRSYYSSIWYLIPALIFGFFFITSQLINLGVLNLPNIFRAARNIGLSVELIGIIPVTGFILRKLHRERLTTERNRLNQENELERVKDLDRLKTKMFTNIAHEFRTPLTLIHGPATELANADRNNTTYKIILRNAQKLLTLINQILDLSKLEAGEMKVNRQEVDLAMYLDQFFASFESLAQSKKIIFNHSQSHLSQFALFDLDKLEKIITNLLSNAFKFTHENERINVRIEYLEKQISIKVQDTGIGIAPEKIDKIFDRFYQVDEGSLHDDTQGLQEGTGIGLALVKELVEVLGGTIKVSSKLEEGTTFELVLPFAPIEKLSENSNKFTSKNVPQFDFVASNISTESNQINDEHPILLIVEDNPDLLTYISSIFEGKYQIITAKDGLKGLEKAAEFIPDVVISDLMMPKLDGLGFCVALKKDERINHIPVIMLTAKASLDDKLIGLTNGADDYLSKPFNKEELQIRVSNLVNQRALMRKKYDTHAHEIAPIEMPKAPTIDELFIQKTKTIINKHLDKSEFDVEQFAEEMNLSSVQLRRKLKAITDQTVTEFVRNYRLAIAAELLKKGEGTVSEIAYKVGFDSMPYFSKVFQEKYGKMASEWK